jgi:hypothetical protein
MGVVLVDLCQIKPKLWTYFFSDSVLEIFGLTGLLQEIIDALYNVASFALRIFLLHEAGIGPYEALLFY